MTEEKTGIVKSKPLPKNGWNKFNLYENDSIFYATKDNLEFEKGDKISFKTTSTETEKDGKTYTNWYVSGKVTILEKADKNNNSNFFTSNTNRSDISRNSVDSGICLSYAKDVVISLLDKGLISLAEVKNKISEYNEHFVQEFKNSKLSFEEKIAEKQEEFPVVKIH